MKELYFVKGDQDSLLLDEMEKLNAQGIKYYIVTWEDYYIIRFYKQK